MPDEFVIVEADIQIYQVSITFLKPMIVSVPLVVLSLNISS